MRLPSDIGPIHFIGIGGIGMSGIAEVLINLGYSVQGSDASDSANVRRLRDRGANVCVGHSAAALGDAEVVVVSTAIKRDNPELTAALAHVALERIGTTAPATVRLHPDDYATVTAGQAAPLGGRQVEVLPDPSVSRGGCLVESEFGFINASVDAQVDEIARAVLGEAPAPIVARRGVA